MKKVVVTGAKGMLGQDLCPILEDEGFEVIETDIDNLDITNSKEVEKKLNEIKPQIVVHCAAYTNVDKAEEDFETAKKINVAGTENIAKACAKNNITLVYISTDYVFDGTKTSKYLPYDASNPINNYGLTKLGGENAVKKYCKKYYIARTSWLYGHHGKNFVETMIKIAKNSEIKVVDDQWGCPTWTVELSKGIIKILKKPFGTYHVCGSGKTTWHDFAKEIYAQMGLETNLLPCKTEEFERPAKRPKFSAMENNGICRPWKRALKDYISLRGEE